MFISEQATIENLNVECAAQGPSRERPFWNRTHVLFIPSTKGTEYEEYRTSRVRNWAPSTDIFSMTWYKEYGVQRVPYSKGTGLGTKYKYFFRRQGTDGTEYDEYRNMTVRRVRVDYRVQSRSILESENRKNRKLSHSLKTFWAQPN